MTTTLWRSFQPDSIEVRADQRTVVGLAVPFNTPTEISDFTDTYREQFAPGSFARTIAERGPSRVKLLLQHDQTRLPIGRAVTLTETPAGLLAELAVSKTVDGDTALELVRDGALDGLSVCFAPITQTRTGDLVTRTEVALREISLTGFPAYDSARVTAIRTATPTTRARAAAVAALAHVWSPTMTTHADLADTLTVRRDHLADQLRRALETSPAPTEDHLVALTDELDDLNGEIAKHTRQIEMDARAAELNRTHTTARAVIGHESRTYVPRDQRGHDSPDFLVDLYRAQLMNDPVANERLARHSREVEIESPDIYTRAVTSGGSGAFTPPAYLVEAWADYARAGRPTANLATKLPLPPDGMTVPIPRITTPTATGIQAAEGDALSNQDIDETTITVPVRTIGGYVDVSRQAIERGTIFETVVMSDLAADYAARLDNQVLAGAGSAGTHTGVLATAGINAITYTDATPTLAELWPKLASAVGSVVSQRFSGPTAVIMAPTTWAWLLAQLDADNRPLVAGNTTGVNSPAVATSPTYDGTAGVLLGLPVVLDGNMPTNLGTGTNETRIIVADMRDTLLLEDAAPVQARFDQPGSANLLIRLTVYGYSAFTAARQPKAVSVIGGTGLITPAL